MVPRVWCRCLVDIGLELSCVIPSMLAMWSKKLSRTCLVSTKSAGSEMTPAVTGSAGQAKGALLVPQFPPRPTQLFCYPSEERR